MVGAGTQENPYVIINSAQLQSVKHEPNQNYKLGNDIDASNTRDWNNGSGFTPYRFEGVLDGNGYSIKDSYSQRRSVLFTKTFGDIKNLSVINATVSSPSTNLVGVIATVHKQGVISNVKVSGNITGRDEVGGLVGSMFTGSVNNSYARSNVTGSGNNIGGLVGRNDYNGIIKNSYSIGNVTGNDVGGAIGENEGGSIENIYWDEVSSGQSSSGFQVSNTTGFNTDVDGDGRADEMIGSSAASNMTGFDFSNTWITQSGDYPELRIFD
jgi:hypothetical protein